MKLNGRMIKSIVESNGGGLKGAHAFIDGYMKPLLEGHKLPSGVTKKAKPGDFSIRQLWEGLVGPVNDTLAMSKVYDPTHKVFREGVRSTGFPIAMDNLMIAKVIEGYNAPNFIGDRLVDVVPTNTPEEDIPGFTDAMGPEEVLEGEPYKKATMGEKSARVSAKKFGRIIDVTEEAIMFDKTGLVLRRAQQIGKAAGTHRENRILRGITGVEANVYRPGGTAETLYDASNNNLNTSNPLSSWTAIDKALQEHAKNVKDDRLHQDGDPIMWNPTQIVVPPELNMVARNIVNATEIRNTSGSVETLSPNPVTPYEVLSSELLTAILGGASDWFFGNFPDQFIWYEVYPIQTQTHGAGSEDAFKSDIVMQTKVRYYGDIACLDTVHVSRNNA